MVTYLAVISVGYLLAMVFSEVVLRGAQGRLFHVLCLYAQCCWDIWVYPEVPVLCVRELVGGSIPELVRRPQPIESSILLQMVCMLWSGAKRLPNRSSNPNPSMVPSNL